MHVGCHTPVRMLNLYDIAFVDEQPVRASLIIFIDDSHHMAGLRSANGRAQRHFKVDAAIKPPEMGKCAGVRLNHWERMAARVRQRIRKIIVVLAQHKLNTTTVRLI